LSVLQGLEVALDVRLVVRDPGAAVGLGDPELVQQFDAGAGDHR
jgi:hypothetical protein